MVSSASGKRYCFNETTKPEGDFEFPRTTFSYIEEKCEMIIRYPEDDEIQLTLINVIKCYYWDCRECSEEYVEIFDKARNSLAKYCIRGGQGNSERKRIKSNTISIIYKDTLNQLLGERSDKVRVYYKRIKPCRHALTGQSGKVQFPIYPNYAHLPIECEWKISTRPGTVISLSFQEIEISQDCDVNLIEVRDGEDQTAPLLNKICDNSHVMKIRSTSSNLWIRMKSMANPGIHFSAVYNAVVNCNPEVVMTSKSRLRRPKNVFCKTWVLTADAGLIAALSFSDMDLESTSRTSCTGNVVEVLDGDTSNAPLIGRYCNLNLPPRIIASKGRTLMVTYKSTNYHDSTNNFVASFISVPPSHYKASCFVQDKALYFNCADNKQIPCQWQCDGAMQCHDNSDEDSCPQMEARWQKLKLFVIIMGSICASTVTFCVGLVCFRKFIIQTNQASESYGRRWSFTDQAPLTPNEELPSPPPSYFNNSDNAPHSVTRGTYFFGNEFSQSGIHSSSLFGIPPPMYRSTESLRQLCVGNSEGNSQQQEETSNISLVQTNFPANEIHNIEGQGISSMSSSLLNETNLPPEREVCSVPCYTLPEDKDSQKLTSSVVENRETCPQSDETANAATLTPGQAETGSTDCRTGDISGTDIGIANPFGAMEV